MATLISMPRLSPTMEEGVVAKWLKQEGDKISPGDIVAEVETDKANMDFPLEDEGVLLKLLAAPGQTIKLGAPVAILGKKGEDITQLLKELGSASPEAPKPVAAAPTQAAAPTPGRCPDAGPGPVRSDRAGCAGGRSDASSHRGTTQRFTAGTKTGDGSWG
jgi:pyruvate/2-oxoglutarate dehydrogenase complex dihydrolipoamide acyltransferase (E2) component